MKYHPIIRIIAVLFLFLSCTTISRRDYDRFVESLPEPSGTVFQDVFYSDNGKRCVLDIFWPEGDPETWKSDPAPVYVCSRLRFCPRRRMDHGFQRIYSTVR